jgi:hypothetical protein
MLKKPVFEETPFSAFYPFFRLSELRFRNSAVRVIPDPCFNPEIGMLRRMLVSIGNLHT